ncbi:MAG: CocE/NonD family hydrolase, partial [Acetobacteraceae bacterium]
MSDADRHSDAWIVPPSRYLEGRPLTHATGRPCSCYIAMRDGVRLAVDTYLPDPAPAQVPTILILTPYYRRFALRPGAAREPCPTLARWRDLFVPRGYGVVIADVRGTGASFGTRDGFRSPRERGDFSEVADWIVAQPWSDGTIGATGVSYVGAACDFLASTGHRAVRAIAPLFAVWDTWADHYYPGGLLLHRLAETYDELMLALDHDRRDLLARSAYYGDPAFDGPQPVDEDADGSLRAAALREHRANFRMPRFIAEFPFRDDALPYDATCDSGTFSPYRYAEGVARDVAVYSVSGWLDGAGYANGAIARFLTLPNPNRYLLLGPWDHGARVNVSPWRADVAPQFSLAGEILRFFDHFLMRRPTGLEREAPVHLFVQHEERWHAAEGWPVARTTLVLHLGANGVLADAPGAGESRMVADFAAGTGTNTRYERIAGLDTRDYYADWAAHEPPTRFASAPLAQDATLAGHAVLTLCFASSEPDAAIHAYLSEVEADGTVRYVTEGLLRALHRRESEPPPE